MQSPLSHSLSILQVMSPHTHALTVPDTQREAPQGLQLSFGVELEFVFVFHEALILRYLNEHLPGSSIVKSISVDDEQQLRQKWQPAIPYRSWALADAGDHPTTVKPSLMRELISVNGTCSTVPTSVRAYITEPLHVLADLLHRSAGGQFSVYHDDDWSKKDQYEAWTVTDDISLSGIDKAAMARVLQPFASNASDVLVEEWDSWPIELVSPPSSESDIHTFLHRLGSILTALQVSCSPSHTSSTPFSPSIASSSKLPDALQPTLGSTYPFLSEPSITALPSPLRHGSTVDLQCGHHVHVGLPTGERFDLRTIQTLAYLTIVYEDEISSLHPPERRRHPNCPDTVNTHIRSNRENLAADPPTTMRRYDANGQPLVDENGRERWFELGMKSLEDIHARLFDDVDAAEVKEEKGLDKLLSYMGCGRDKDRIVNFRALLGGKDGKRPKTVEFRQHAGTLDVQEVGWWVRFCLGLVQLAWRYGVEGQVGKMKSWEDKIDIEDLWEAMGFQEEGREFYRKRREQWGMVVMPGDVVVWTADVDEPISEEEDEEFWRRLESEAGSMSSAEEEDAAR